MIDTDDDGEGARTFAAAIAVAASAADGRPTDVARADSGLAAPDLERARGAFQEWAQTIHAPAVEVRRAQRRLAAIAPAVPSNAVASALSDPDPRRAAIRIVEVCAARDRDFGWDIPLRDLARALLEAAVRARRAAALRRGAPGLGDTGGAGRGGPSM